MKLYENLAETLAERIEQGYYQAGDKLPSLRKMSKEHNVSIATVQEAYYLLEDRYLLQSRPKSGYYILPKRSDTQLPETTRPEQKPVTVARWELVHELLTVHERDELLILGRATPNVAMPTLKPLLKLTADMSRRADISQLTYDSLQGCSELRHQISRLMVDSGCRLHPDDIVITTGCQEALTCSMRALTSPGDIVASESPTYYGPMQTVQVLGLKMLEIPTNPETGISLDALELALEQWPIKVLQVTPSCNNPTGHTMPDEHKKRLLEMANEHDIAIIEDDIYGDLAYTYPRSRSIKSYDTEGRVLYCSSFSKTLSPAFRTGWCAPGRYIQQVKHMKYVSTACNSILHPRTIAEFVAQGFYERHIRKCRTQYLHNRDRMMEWIRAYFPEETKISFPKGGFLLWVELPKYIDTVILNKQLQKENISIAPGIIFTAAEKYKNCMRLSYSHDSTPEIEQAIKTVGELAKQF